MRFYIKTDKHGIVRDVSTYPHQGFEEINYDDHVLPRNILAGYYKWNGTDFIEDEALKEEIIRENGGYLEEELQLLREENERLKAANEVLTENLIDFKIAYMSVPCQSHQDYPVIIENLLEGATKDGE